MINLFRKKCWKVIILKDDNTRINWHCDSKERAKAVIKQIYDDMNQVKILSFIDDTLIIPTNSIKHVCLTYGYVEVDQ